MVNILNKRKLIIFVLLIVFSVVVILINLFGNDKYINSDDQLDDIYAKNQEKYNQVINSIKSSKYDDALKNLNEIKTNVEFNNLRNYILAKKEFREKDYKKGLSFLNQLSNINFANDQFKVDVIKLRSISNIKIGNYDDAIKDLISYENEDKDFKVLYLYAMALREEKAKNMYDVGLHLSAIPADYKGNLSKDVQKTKVRLKKAIKLYEKDLSYLVDKSMQKTNNNYPSIGMADYELEEVWGKPEKINRTTTAYGVKEQWVYSGNRYVYLEDHYITAIQD